MAISQEKIDRARFLYEETALSVEGIGKLIGISGQTTRKKKRDGNWQRKAYADEFARCKYDMSQNRFERNLNPTEMELLRQMYEEDDLSKPYIMEIMGISDRIYKIKTTWMVKPKGVKYRKMLKDEYPFGRLITEAKEQLQKHIGKGIRVKYIKKEGSGGTKTEQSYTGVIEGVYPNVFTVITNTGWKTSFMIKEMALQKTCRSEYKFELIGG